MFKKVRLPGIIYEMTSKCNLQCKYCYNYWKKDNDKPNYNYDTYKPKTTLKKLFKSVKTDYITFSGGEPTINFEELLDCIMYVKSKNKKVTIITNATLLDKEKIKILADLKVDLIEITVNSFDKNIHESINNVKGSFNKTIENIKEIQKKGIEVVVPIVIIKYNVKNIEKTLEYIYDLGIKQIMVNRYNIGGNGCNEYNEILPTLEELRSAYKKCNEFANKHKVKLYSLVCTPHCVVNPDDYPNIVFSNCGITNLDRRYTLTRNGDIRYCNHSPEVVGNIYNSNMSQILENEKLKMWAKIEPEFCSNCTEKEKCQYGCRAASQQMEYRVRKRRSNSIHI